MTLEVIGSGSSGNCYVFTPEIGKRLIIDCGMNFKKVKQSISFDINTISCALLTHSHLDHSKYVKNFIDAGIDVYMSKETKKEINVFGEFIQEINHGQTIKRDGYTIMAFDLHHDVKCFGYLVEHYESGKFALITDTYFCDYTFPDLNNIIIEANFCHDIIKQKYNRETRKEFLKNRIFKSHFSLRDCKEMLSANDLRKVQNIVLIHLSDSNSNEERFKNEVHELTGKNTVCASKGLIIDFNKDLF